MPAEILGTIINQLADDLQKERRLTVDLALSVKSHIDYRKQLEEKIARYEVEIKRLQIFENACKPQSLMKPTRLIIEPVPGCPKEEGHFQQYRVREEVIS